MTRIIYYDNTLRSNNLSAFYFLSIRNGRSGEVMELVLRTNDSGYWRMRESAVSNKQSDGKSVLEQ